MRKCLSPFSFLANWYQTVTQVHSIRPKNQGEKLLAQAATHSFKESEGLVVIAFFCGLSPAECAEDAPLPSMFYDRASLCACEI